MLDDKINKYYNKYYNSISIRYSVIIKKIKLF